VGGAYGNAELKGLEKKEPEQQQQGEYTRKKVG
jgi:hypothetical protein